MTTAALHLAVAAAYVAAAFIGFRLAFVAEQITTVWAPTGIAMAALLLGGLRFWPAVWAGALVANLGTAAPAWTAFVIASGNTLEAVAAVVLLRRVPQFDQALRRIADVAAFVLIAAISCTLISATIGVGVLCMAGVQPWSRFAALWSDWWLGDALGALVVAPAVLTAAHHPWSKQEALRAAMWGAAAFLLTHALFGQVAAASPHPIEYVVFPLAIAAAVIGGPGPTTWVVLTASVAAIWHTVNQAGPFASSEAHYSLILLQTFTGVLAGTSLLLAASVAERRTTQGREALASASLRQSRDVLTLAMRAGSMGAWTRNLRTNEVWWSRELEEIFGLQPGGFNRTEAGFFEFVHPDDRDGLRKAVEHALAHSTDYVVEFRFRHASGEWRWMEGRGRAIYAGDRTVLSLYGIGVDITERKRAEIALHEAKRSAESANRLKDQFLATLSHELRTPLNVILGYARMLQSASIPPDKQKRAIDAIERNAVAQNELVEELLDMSRITTGKVRLDARPVPAVGLIRDAIDGIKPAADAKRLTLHTEIEIGPEWVRADATRLQQVFWNVLNNAVRFTAEGGHVRITAHRRAANLEVVISDSGAGIAAEFLPFVFEPFRQAESRFDRMHGGLGLGLAIAKQLIELHGGSIFASSPGLGQGATFTLTLPCVDEPSLTNDADNPGETPVHGRRDALAGMLGGLDVLLVEDEADTLAMYRDALVDAGAKVRTASTARTALELAEASPPELLVTDLGLPGMDGYELLAAFRSRTSLSTCPAVAVSAYAQADDRSRAIAAGFLAHVAKPVDPPALVTLLRSLIEPATRA